MGTVNIHQAKTHLSRLLEAAARGEEVIIAKAGKPILRLVPIEKPMRGPGALKGTFIIDDAFFEPLPDDLLDLMGMVPSTIPSVPDEAHAGYPRADPMGWSVQRQLFLSLATIKSFD
jgi:prevent-host-death family protein